MRLSAYVAWLFLTWLLPSLQIVSAITQDQIDIRYNNALLTRRRKLVLGRILQFGPEQSLSDNNIVHIAMVAYLAMEARFDSSKQEINSRLGHSVAQPPILTVLVVDNTAYIASSARGGPSLFYTETRRDEPYKVLKPQAARTLRQYIRDGLNACAIQASRSSFGHRSGGNCGEFMSLLAYEQQNGNAKPRDGAIVSVTRDDEGNLVIRKPCSTPRTGIGGFGCAQTIDWEGWNGGLRVIPQSTREESFTVSNDRLSRILINFP